MASISKLAFLKQNQKETDFCSIPSSKLCKAAHKTDFPATAPVFKAGDLHWELLALTLKSDGEGSVSWNMVLKHFACWGGAAGSPNPVEPSKSCIQPWNGCSFDPTANNQLLPIHFLGGGKKTPDFDGLLCKQDVPRCSFPNAVSQMLCSTPRGSQACYMAVKPFPGGFSSLSFTPLDTTRRHQPSRHQAAGLLLSPVTQPQHPQPKTATCTEPKRPKNQIFFLFPWAPVIQL